MWSYRYVMFRKQMKQNQTKIQQILAQFFLLNESYLQNNHSRGRSHFRPYTPSLERRRKTAATYVFNLALCRIQYQVPSLNFLGITTVTAVLRLKKVLIHMMFVSLIRGCQKSSKCWAREPSNVKNFQLIFAVCVKLVSSKFQTCLDLKIVVEPSS